MFAQAAGAGETSGGWVVSSNAGPSETNRGATDESLDTLLAERAIRRVIQNYCRGIDRLDRELLASSFHPHARVVIEGWFEGLVPELVDFVIDAHIGFQATSHHVTSVTAELRGDHAVSEAYVHASLRPAPEDGAWSELVYRGRYLDRLTKRAGCWAIDHRLLVCDLFSRYAVDPLDVRADDPGARRAGTDASRPLFEGLDSA